MDVSELVICSGTETLKQEGRAEIVPLLSGKVKKKSPGTKQTKFLNLTVILLQVINDMSPNLVLRNLVPDFSSIISRL